MDEGHAHLALIGQPRLPESLKVLKGIELFKDLEPRELRALESITHERNYVPGEIVFEQGQDGLGMYIIVSATGPYLP
jgi:signal-transduction protein with cAMP-binding, CBS, and nucleotidyltransferase domain